MTSGTRTIRAPRGTTLSCKGWPQEAALRMLMNNLDPEVAERPEDLVVYGGSGRAARDWAVVRRDRRGAARARDDETLLVQSGKPVARFRTHANAPRVLIANALLVPHWATWDVFRDLERKGLTMYGQMTAGSWIYIGTQGILQGTYETLAALARRHFGGSLARPHRGHGGPRRHGRRAAARRDDERRRGAGRGGGPGTRRAAAGDAVRGRGHRLARRCARAAGPVGARRRGAIGCAVRQRRRRAAGAGRARRPARRRHRPDLGPRCAQRLRAARAVDGARRRRCASASPDQYIAAGDGRHGGARPRDARAPGSRQRGVRLRQQPARAGRGRRRRRRVRDSRLRARVHPAALLRRQRSLPLGGPFGRSCRHRRDRSRGARALPARRGAGAVDPAGAANASRSRDCRHASAGSAMASARASACA